MQLAACCKEIRPWTSPLITPSPPETFKELRNEEAGSCTGWRFRAKDTLSPQNELSNRHLHSSETTSAILLIQSHRLLFGNLFFSHTWFLNVAGGCRVSQLGFSQTQKCVLISGKTSGNVAEFLPMKHQTHPHPI